MAYLWLYSKDEATNFNADIADDNTFKYFKCKDKLLENIVADGNNSILENAAIVVPLKYLSKFQRSLEMPLINCKLEWKLRWTKHCVLVSAGVTNDVDYSNNIIFTIKDKKLYVPVVALSGKDNQKLSKLLSKGFEMLVYWN